VYNAPGRLGKAIAPLRAQTTGRSERTNGPVIVNVAALLDPTNPPSREITARELPNVQRARGTEEGRDGDIYLGGMRLCGPSQRRRILMAAVVRAQFLEMLAQMAKK
jgi:hypothetical protein